MCLCLVCKQNVNVASPRRVVLWELGGGWHGEDGLDSNGRGGCPFSRAVPRATGDAALRGEERCWVNPCFPSAWLVVNGAVLMGLVRGLQLMSVVHATPRAAAIHKLPGGLEVAELCIKGRKNGQMWLCPVGFCYKPPLLL